MIELRKWIEPDISMLLPKPEGSYTSVTYFTYSILFKEQILVITPSNEDGTGTGYGSTSKYYGLRLVEDKIEVCIPKFGWIPIYEEIQNKYNDTIADKEILGV